MCRFDSIGGADFGGSDFGGSDQIWCDDDDAGLCGGGDVAAGSTASLELTRLGPIRPKLVSLVDVSRRRDCETFTQTLTCYTFIKYMNPCASGILNILLPYYHYMLSALFVILHKYM